MTFCHQCGASVAPGDTFCGSCGIAQPKVSTEESSRIVPENPSKELTEEAGIEIPHISDPAGENLIGSSLPSAEAVPPVQGPRKSRSKPEADVPKKTRAGTTGNRQPSAKTLDPERS